MKPLHVTVTVRNNQIISRRRMLGMNRRQFSEASGIHVKQLGEYELCKLSPVDEDGNWRKSAKILADFLCEDIEVLFSEDVLAIKKARITFEVSKNTLRAMYEHQRILSEVGVSLEKAELSGNVKKLIDSTLTDGEKKVIKHLYFSQEKSPTAVGLAKRVKRSAAAINQRHHKALKKLYKVASDL